MDTNGNGPNSVAGSAGSVDKSTNPAALDPLDNRHELCYTQTTMQTYEEVDGPGLRKVREARGLPRRVLAEKLGCSLGAIQNWEKEISYPLPTFRKKLEEVLHVRIKPRVQA